MQKFMTSEGHRAPRRGAIVNDASRHENAKRPTGSGGERRRNRDFARRTVAMSGQAIARSVEAEVAIRGNEVETQKVGQVGRLLQQQLLCDRVCVLARSAPDLAVALHRMKQLAAGLAVHVPTQPFELGRRQELTNLGDAPLSERPPNIVDRGEGLRAARTSNKSRESVRLASKVGAFRELDDLLAQIENHPHQIL